MIYRTLQLLLNIFFRIYYRLHYRNIDNVPKTGPVILAPNHVNAFIDPTISCMLLWRKVRFFARGDVFKGKVARYFLNKMNISPMYRIQEGFAEVKKNDKTFEECKKLLSENKAILLFPEAICVQERRLRKLRKGLARILFISEEEFDFKKEVLVVPVGLNYSDPAKLRSKLFIDFGKPVTVCDYIEKYKNDKVRTINEFTQFLEDKIRETLVVIDDPANDELMKCMEEMFLHPLMKENGFDAHDPEKDHIVTKQLGDAINLIGKSFPDRFHSFREKVTAYVRELHARRLRDHLLRTGSIEAMSTLSFIKDFLIIWFGMPLYVAGMFMNYPPYFFAERFARKKAKEIEFHASVAANLSWILWFLWFAIQLVAVGLLLRDWPLLAIYALLVPLTLFFSIRFDPVMRKIFGRWRLMRLVRKEKAVVERLIFTRNDIEQEFEKFKEFRV